MIRGLALFFLMISLGCAHNGEAPEADLYESNVVLSDSLRAGRYSNIFFAGQPKNSDWKALKEAGFTHVINLRGENEHDQKSEKQNIQKQGMIYTSLPLDAAAPLTKESVKVVTLAVKAHRKSGKTLIHCGTGNRAAYWAGAHFYLDHEYSKEKSIDLAKRMGMTNPKLETKLSSFIDNTKK